MTQELSDDWVVGLNIPARPGMKLAQVSTPALIIDLNAFERNVVKMGTLAKEMGVRHRAHAKTHKCATIALIQMQMGGACGVCCQKVAEAEALVANGVTDVLVSNQVTEPAKVDRLAALAGKARILVCVDDAANVPVLSVAASRHGTSLECLVEIDVGATRCGVPPGAPAVALAQQIVAAPGLSFAGIQAYQGSAQHVQDYSERKAKSQHAIDQTKETVARLGEAGIECAIVAGAGSGTYPFEGESGVYTELQCGSYIFMDADYQTIKDAAGQPVSEFENSLFVYTSVMSVALPGQAVCDAGLKSHSVDSGLPTIYGRSDVRYLKCSDEHGVISDPGNTLKLNDKLLLVPGHCDPTCNLYDWYVGVRDEVVEQLWLVTARGMSF